MIKESLRVFLVFLLVLVVSFYGFSEAKKRERDVKRNADISLVAQALEAYRQAFGYYPEVSDDGRIIACAGEDTKVLKDQNGLGVREPGAVRDKLVNLVPCDWGKDALRDALDGNYPAFLEIIPQDPLSDKGYSYRYEFKDGKYYVYVSYETRRMPDYNKNILLQKIKCGIVFCNAARSNGVEIVR